MSAKFVRSFAEKKICERTNNVHLCEQFGSFVRMFSLIVRNTNSKFPIVLSIETMQFDWFNHNVHMAQGDAIPLTICNSLL